jgi:hypothetical protein
MCADFPRHWASWLCAEWDRHDKGNVGGALALDAPAWGFANARCDDHFRCDDRRP